MNFINDIVSLQATDHGIVESKIPKAYRLKKTKDGLVLQGCFEWFKGQDGGSEWRDIPTHEEETK